jgi:Flp pilus assembly protein TadB
MGSGDDAPATKPAQEGKGISRMAGILWIVLVVLIVLWLLGLIASVGGNLIHLLLVIALIVLVFNLLSGRRTL